MPVYVYQARDVSGKKVSGRMESPSKSEVIERLRKLGFLPTEVAEPLGSMGVDSFFNRLRGVGGEEMAMFNVQLANLIHAGIPLLTSFHTLIPQIENRRLRAAVGSVAREVETGQSFSDALLHHPQIFPKLFVSLVQVGEATGKLDQVLARYADYCEQQIELHQKIQGATFYPIILLFASLGVTLFVVTTLIPQFVQIFLKAGVPLPLPTLILYQAGRALQQFWLSFIFSAAALVVGFQYYAGTRAGRFQVDRLKLALPVMGSLYREAAIARFGRTLGMLIASGVPILPSLEIARDSVGNEVVARAVENARSAVEKGEKVSDPLRISGEFPADALQMISVGEETGRLDEMLNKIADFYDRAVNHNVKHLTVFLEPVLLIAMGCLVGLIMASLLLPMFDMLKIIRR